MKPAHILFLMLLIITNANAQVIKKMGRSQWIPNYDSLYRGKTYPPFELTTTDGVKINNSSCAGKVTLIEFWFESCGGCHQEFGKLNELYDHIKNDTTLQLVAVTFDSPESLPDFIKQYKLKYPIATTNDHDKFHKLNYGMGCPSSIVIDRTGKIVVIGLGDIGGSSVSETIQFLRSFAK